jgi:hypothetical protein
VSTSSVAAATRSVAMRSDFPGTTVTLRLYFIGAKPLMTFFLTTWGAAFFLVDKTEARIQGMRLPSWSLTGIVLEMATRKVQSEARLFGSTTRFFFLGHRLEGWGVTIGTAVGRPQGLVSEPYACVSVQSHLHASL